MKRNRNRFFIKLIAIILSFSLCAPIGVKAVEETTVQPRASAYLMAYTAYICAMGNGDLEIWFDITGTDYWADIGVLSVLVYESTDNVNWHWVKTFLHDTTEGMLAHNTFCHMGHVDYKGVPGRYYKAYVCIWAGPEDGGDARYMWTEVERCT